MQTNNTVIKNVEELEIDAAFTVRKEKQDQVKWHFETLIKKINAKNAEIKKLAEEIEATQEFMEELKELSVDEALEVINKKNNQGNPLMCTSSNGVWYSVGSVNYSA
jgi:cell division protein FtsB